MRIERAELAVYDARAFNLLKRWQEHGVPCGGVDSIARPQPQSMAALRGDLAEAIPLALEDPRLVIEGFVNECREHRFISGIHAFTFVPDMLSELNVSAHHPQRFPRFYSVSSANATPRSHCQINPHKEVDRPKSRPCSRLSTRA